MKEKSYYEAVIVDKISNGKMTWEEFETSCIVTSQAKLRYGVKAELQKKNFKFPLILKK